MTTAHYHAGTHRCHDIYSPHETDAPWIVRDTNGEIVINDGRHYHDCVNKINRLLRLTSAKTQPLKRQQRAMLDFITGFILDQTYPPTYEEIRTGLHLSTKSLVDYHLAILEAAGYVKRDPWLPRGISLVLKD